MEATSQWRSPYLMLFLVCCGEWSLLVKGAVSRDPRFLLALARGQQASLFVVSESLQKRTPLYLRGTPGHSNSHTTQVLFRLVHHPPGCAILQGLLAILALESSRFTGGAMYILNTQQVSFLFPQEPTPPSFAKHSDRDNRLSCVCACGTRVLRTMTHRHQNTGCTGAGAHSLRATFRKQ